MRRIWRSEIDRRRAAQRTQFETVLRKEARRLALRAASGGPKDQAAMFAVDERLRLYLEHLADPAIDGL